MPYKSPVHRVLGRLGKFLLAGLAVIVPVAASVLVLIWAFNRVDDLLQPVVAEIFGHPIVGLGLGATLVLILVVGIITDNFLGRKLVQLWDAFFRRLPLFREIYTGAKQALETIAGTGKVSTAAFREVVLVKFPSEEMNTIAFITTEYTNEDGDKRYGLFVPTTPIPWTGFTILATEESLTRTKIRVDEAIKMCISGVILAPPAIRGRDGAPIFVQPAHAPKAGLGTLSQN